MNTEGLAICFRQMAILDDASIIPITDPFSGYTRYLAQSKPDGDYIKSDFSKFMCFWDADGKTCLPFSDDVDERQKMNLAWRDALKADTAHVKKTWHMLLIDFQPEDDDDWLLIDMVNDCISNDPESIAEALQIFTESVQEEVNEVLTDGVYDVVNGVWHGQQRQGDEGNRLPHVHLLFARRRKR